MYIYHLAYIIYTQLTRSIAKIFKKGTLNKIYLNSRMVTDKKDIKILVLRRIYFWLDPGKLNYK